MAECPECGLEMSWDGCCTPRSKKPETLSGHSCSNCGRDYAKKFTEADLDAAREEGRKERTVDIVDKTLCVMSCVCTHHIRRAYPECFEKGEGDV